MDTQQRLLEKLVGLREEATSPPNSDVIINEGETPYWEIGDPAERNRVCSRQRKRMERMLHPERATEVQNRYNERHPGARAEIQRRFEEGHPGYFIESERRYREKYPGRNTEIQRRFHENHPGYRAESKRKFLKTPKGRAGMAKGSAARREYSTDPALYAARVLLLHSLQEPCTKCHTLYDITHQIDHVLALCLGGTDDWDNLQPLCVLCHRVKTQEDLDKLRIKFEEGEGEKQ